MWEDLISDPGKEGGEWDGADGSLLQDTGPHVYVRAPPPGAGGQEGGRRAPQIKHGQQRRDGGTEQGTNQTSSIAGQRGSERVANQSSRGIGRMAGETNHGDPISSAARPRGGGSGGREKVAASVKKSERESGREGGMTEKRV